MGKELVYQLLQPATFSRGDRTASLRGFLETDSIFVHVPKTAGMSVVQALYDNIGIGHIPVGDFRQLFRPRFMDRAFVYTFVRNPWDRIYSAYQYLKAGGWDHHDVEFANAHLKGCDSFEQFLFEYLDRPAVQSIPHFQPSMNLLLDHDGAHFRFDFIGRYENLSRDFDVVRKRVRPAAKLGHLNPTKSTKPRDDVNDYIGAYSVEMKRIISDRFADTIDALGYSFAGHSKDVPALALGARSQR